MPLNYIENRGERATYNLINADSLPKHATALDVLDYLLELDEESDVDGFYFEQYKKFSVEDLYVSVDFIYEKYWIREEYCPYGLNATLVLRSSVKLLEPTNPEAEYHKYKLKEFEEGLSYAVSEKWVERAHAKFRA